MATKRKTKTALVLNPAGRSLSIGGSRRANPSRRRRRRTSAVSRRRRRNPVSAQALTRTRRRSNPARRRRRNPATTSGLLVAAVFAGLGVSLFDFATSKFLPQQSAVFRAGVKLGGAWLFQSKLGNSIPILGRYKNDIALVLAVLGVVDLFKLYLFPMVASVAGSAGLLIPAGEGDTTGNIYGNAYNPNYMYS